MPVQPLVEVPLSLEDKMKKAYQVYHITWVTHNSRVSERMVEFGVKHGEPLLLDDEQEKEITTYILQITKEDDLRILVYNICRDHIHMILVCEEQERDNIIRKLKGKTTQVYKDNRGIKDEFHLWAQKYSCTVIKDEEQILNAINYIQFNRKAQTFRQQGVATPCYRDVDAPFSGIQPVIGLCPPTMAGTGCKANHGAGAIPAPFCFSSIIINYVVK